MGGCLFPPKRAVEYTIDSIFDKMPITQMTAFDYFTIVSLNLKADTQNSGYSKIIDNTMVSKKFKEKEIFIELLSQMDEKTNLAMLFLLTDGSIEEKVKYLKKFIQKYCFENTEQDMVTVQFRDDFVSQFLYLASFAFIPELQKRKLITKSEVKYAEKYLNPDSLKALKKEILTNPERDLARFFTSFEFIFTNNEEVRRKLYQEYKL